MSVTDAQRSALPLPAAVPAGRAEAARAVWDWRGERRRAAAAAQLKAIRTRGIVMLAVGGVVGFLFYRFISRTLAYPVWGIATFVAAAALASPRGLYPWVDRAVGLLVFVVGRGLTLALLIPIYYLVFAPFGLLFRRGERSKLSRKLDPAATSYWIARDPTHRDLRAYERPF
jgi:hypothetical protein